MAEVADFVQPQSAAIDVVGAVRRYAACGPVLLSSVTRNRSADCVAARRCYECARYSRAAPGSHREKRIEYEIASGSDCPNLRPPV
jgi:hypothetical protein